MLLNKKIIETIIKTLHFHVIFYIFYCNIIYYMPYREKGYEWDSIVTIY